MIRTALSDGRQVELPDAQPSNGWVVAVRLRRTTRVKQGQWAIMVQPYPDAISAFDLALVEDKQKIPDNAIVYTKRKDAHERAEGFTEWAGFEASGDFELLYVSQKMKVVYHGWEVASPLRDV